MATLQTLLGGRTLFLDESDSQIYDNETQHNYSETADDPTLDDYNPLAWIYPILNEFINSEEFLTAHTIGEEIQEARDYLIRYGLHLDEDQIRKWLMP